MPQWAGSCWYYLRYIDPQNDERPWDPAKERYWMPVDLYVGGAEHAVLHLLYSRFWHKVLFDRGLVSTAEPFQKLVNQGMILGEIEYTGFQRRVGTLGLHAVVEDDDHGFTPSKEPRRPRRRPVKLARGSGHQEGRRLRPGRRPEVRVDARAHKMSKSRGNVINPDEIVEEYGADSLRLYEMFMGPLEAVKPWSMKGVEGVYRFLGRAWRMIVDAEADEVRLDPKVQDVDADARAGQDRRPDGRGGDRRPRGHAVQHGDQPADGVHQRLHGAGRPAEGGDGDVHPAARPDGPSPRPRSSGRSSATTRLWPTSPGRRYDPALLKDDEVEVPVQVNGKLRGRIVVPGGLATARRSRPPRGATSRSPRCSRARRSARSSSCRASWSISSSDDGRPDV